MSARLVVLTASVAAATLGLGSCTGGTDGHPAPPTGRTTVELTELTGADRTAASGRMIDDWQVVRIGQTDRVVASSSARRGRAPQVEAVDIGSRRTAAVGVSNATDLRTTSNGRHAVVAATTVSDGRRELELRITDDLRRWRPVPLELPDSS